MTETRTTPRKSLFRLIADVPELVKELVRGEIEMLKAELTAKAKLFGVGAALFAIAAVFALLLLGVLLTAAILALALVMPGWLAALLVAVLLIIVIAVLVLIGVRQVKQAMPPMPKQTLLNLKRDLNAVKGIGRREV